MKAPKKQLKAVIFDMDGTIIDSNEVWNNAVASMLVAYGVAIIEDHHKPHLAALSGVSLSKSAVILKDLFKIEAEHHEMIETVVTTVKQSLAKGISFIKGFEEFHTVLKKNNIASCLATNADDESLKVIIKSMKLDSFFGPHIFNASHVNNKAKPDPAMFLHAAQQLGVHPSECVVFEDSPIGFAAAKAAGMVCVAIKNTHNKDILHEVARAIEHYHEAHITLKELFHIIELQ